MQPGQAAAGAGPSLESVEATIRGAVVGTVERWEEGADLQVHLLELCGACGRLGRGGRAACRRDGWWAVL